MKIKLLKKQFLKVGLLICSPIFLGVTAASAMKTDKPRVISAEGPSCKKIVEIPLGGFGDSAAAKKFTKKFGPENRYGAVREDTHLQYVGNFKTKRRCNFAKEYFSSLHYVEPSSLVLVETLAGSETKLKLWDVDACKVVWEGKKFGSTGQPLWFRDKEVIFRPTCWDCNARPAHEPCACDAAIVLKMKANCEFSEASKDSLSVTQKEIGVAFKGNKKVVHRFTPQAQVAK